MLFWKRKKKNEDQEEVGTGKESGSKGKGPLAGLRRKGVPLEVKLLAVEALRAGLVLTTTLF